MRHSGRAVAWGGAAALLLGGGIAVRTIGADDRGSPLELRVVEVDSATRVIELRGVRSATRRRLEARAPDDAEWSAAFALRVEGDSISGVHPFPPVLARYEVDGDRLRLTPRFPLTPGVAYRIRFDPGALARLAGAAAADERAALEERFVVPASRVPRTTRVLGVHPSVSRVPANLLRFYVELSAPMAEGTALEHIGLLDASGREVAGAFLQLDDELWDPDRRRLTVLFDPGRVKRGIRTNIESGSPLVSGRRYRLVIDSEWRDGRGAGLASGFEFEFDVGASDRRSPDPTQWRIRAPAAGTHEPLRVAFGEPLDHALAAHMISVVDGARNRIAGRGVLAPGDSAWSFVPELAWPPGEHRVSVDVTMEDLAGNSVARPFDADRRGGDASAERAAELAREPREVPFMVRVRSVAEPATQPCQGGQGSGPTSRIDAALARSAAASC